MDGPCVILLDSWMGERPSYAPIAATRFWGYRVVCRFYIENEMYNVVCDNEEVEVEDLEAAMKVAKLLDKFVVIRGNGMEIVGRFGADSVENGECPDGVAYDWRKRR